MNISVKFFLNDDIRRISVPKDDITWGNLTELVRSVYKGRSDEQWDNTRICYVDDEGDRCTVTSEAELQEAVSLCQARILRLILVEPKQPQEQRDSDPHFFVRDRKNRCERKPDWKGFGHRKGALESEGLALMDASRFSEAKEKFEEQLSLCRNPWRKSLPLYHIACCEARLGNISSSLDFLRRSTKWGFSNADRITNDPNFQDMKEVPQFQEIVSEIVSNPRWNRRRFQEQTPSPLAEKHGQRILLKKQARELLNSGDQEEIKKARDLFHQMAALTVKEWHKRIPLYNLARCEAMLGNVEEAMKFLKEAINLGFKNLKRMENDSEFASLQDLDEFKSLVESVRLLKTSEQGRKHFCRRYRLGETQGSTTSSEGNQS